MFAAHPRDHWAEVFEGTDACVSPVLSLDEVAAHPHHRARGRFFTRDGIRQPSPAPEFSRTAAATPAAPPPPGAHHEAVLRDWAV